MSTWRRGVLVLSNTQFSGPFLMLGTTSASFYQIPFLLLDLSSPFLSLGIKGTTSDSRVVRTNLPYTKIEVSKYHVLHYSKSDFNF